MKTIATALQKGGVGKTTMAVSLAAELAKNYRVVIVDADPQGNTTGSLLKGYKHELAEVLDRKCSVQDALVQTDFGNLYVLPTVALDVNDPELSKLRIYRSRAAASYPRAIINLVKELSEYFDYCIIDTCPAFDLFEENIFSACDEVIAVMQLDVFSQDGLTIFNANLNSFKERKGFENPTFSRIILNSVNMSLKYTKDLLDVMSRQESFDCFVVPQDQAFKKAQDHQKPIQYLTKKDDEKTASAKTLEALKLIAENIR